MGCDRNLEYLLASDIDIGEREKEEKGRWLVEEEDCVGEPSIDARPIACRPRGPYPRRERRRAGRSRVAGEEARDRPVIARGRLPAPGPGR